MGAATEGDGTTAASTRPGDMGIRGKTEGTSTAVGGRCDGETDDGDVGGTLALATGVGVAEVGRGGVEGGRAALATEVLSSMPELSQTPASVFAVSADDEKVGRGLATLASPSAGSDDGSPAGAAEGMVGFGEGSGQGGAGECEGDGGAAEDGGEEMSAGVDTEAAELDIWSRKKIEKTKTRDDTEVSKQLPSEKTVSAASAESRASGCTLKSWLLLSPRH